VSDTKSLLRSVWAGLAEKGRAGQSLREPLGLALGRVEEKGGVLKYRNGII
jgi:hypothetical protein